VEADSNIETTVKLVGDSAARNLNAALVVLGCNESEESIAMLAEAGASGYVPAHASFQEMLSVIYSARKGEFACPTDVTYALFARLAQLAQKKKEEYLRSFGLTIRERQVMQLLTEGLSNREIGDSLAISEITAKNHVHHLLSKIGIRDRRVAARIPELPPPRKDRAANSSGRGNELPSGSPQDRHFDATASLRHIPRHSNSTCENTAQRHRSGRLG
jgi:DNA-binding NarL/FixJ family response regulator